MSSLSLKPVYGDDDLVTNVRQRDNRFFKFEF